MVINVWSRNRFHVGTISGKNSKSSKKSTQESLLVTKEVEAILKKRVIQKTSAGAILVQPLVSKQKGWELLTCNELKKSEWRACIYSRVC